MPNKTNKPTIKTTAIKSPKFRSDGTASASILGPDKKLSEAIQRVVEKHKKEILSDPRRNPAGKAQLEFKTSSSSPIYSNTRTTKVESSFAPDPSASARSAKIRKSREPKLQQSSSPSRSQLLKSRGTQSSATRTLIK
jgi:hypothetical protein